MTDVLCTVNVGFGDVERFKGKTVNIHTSWATAYVQSGSLATIYEADVDADTPAIAKGDAITQVADDTGVDVDDRGLIKFYVAASTVMFLSMNDPFFPNGYKVVAPAS